MFSLLMTFLLVVGVAFGSGGAALAAAQTSLPSDALYPLKTWSEDVQFQWADSVQTRLELLLQFQARRMEEIRTMLQNGQVPPQAVLTRAQTQSEQALHLAASLPPEEAAQALMRVQAQLQQQIQVMTQLHLPDQANPALVQVQAQVRAMLTERIQLAGQGAEDPQWLREQLHIREQLRLQEQDCTSPDCLQYQNQYQYQNGTGNPSNNPSPAGGNPWAVGTPTPGSGYGPGESQNPWTDTTPTPGSGYGPGESQNPWTDTTPTPGSGY
ncbi:MAG: DUF5667 domain-containing protein, partial [Anaerolineales bacterium]